MPFAKAHAIVVLPPAPPAGIADARLRRWLASGRVLRRDAGLSVVERVLTVLCRSMPAAGLAALRFLGDTGEAADDWLAGADPVNLEARLDRVYLHSLQAADLSPSAMQRLFDELQENLGDGRPFRFVWSGRHGYLRGTQEIAVAGAAPGCVDGQRPDDYLPAGAAAAAYHELTTEIQMYLHERIENRAGADAGLHPVNALWLWGGGRLPAPAATALPTLFGDEALCRGYWLAARAAAEPWPGTLGACAARAGGDFVTVQAAAAASADLLPARLHECRALLARGLLSRLTLLFAGGTVAEFKRGDRLRFWRRDAGALGQAGT